VNQFAFSFRETRKLLSNTNRATLTLTGPCIGLGALTANRKATLVANTTVAVNRSKTLHLSLLFTTKVTFDGDFFALNYGRNLHKLLFGQLTRADVWTYASVLKDA
jgi:hypothetical protein